ncbi:FkbM family methyltransferase [Tamlana sp. 2201CG12-4]|uniref:FkbM family methyltransferase n=1 Tax=Tamlana sp. 2201CG12-4 TaxID=3112582 RepID=UPI002DBF7BAA|nr:FkbM family methyltransferase [Tamlana sp. 2201CG12-4]MEC3907332.1 FkbM family methyltransferase [Tamlana sp. 2201CG12-4]
MYLSYRRKILKNNIYLWLCQYAVYILKLYYKFNSALFLDYRSKCLEKHARNCEKEFFVLQVGANDGFDNDPIHKFIMKYGWKGLLIEPQPKVFNKFLKKTYSRFPKIELLNAALSSDLTQKKLYCISFSDHRWATGLSRFNKESFKELIDNGYIASQARQQGVELPDSTDNYISETKVNAVNFDFIINEYGITNVDFLQIDAEGYDYEILKLFPLDKIKPKFINLEYSHFDEKTKEECTLLLTKNHYKCVEVEHDLFCVLYG